MNVYKSRGNKISTRKVFLDAIDRRDVMTIHECLATKGGDQDRNPIADLSRSKLADIWQIVCDVILTLPPVNRPFLAANQDDTTSGTGDTDTSTNEQEQQQRDLPEDAEARTHIAMGLLKEVFSIVSSKSKEPPLLANIATVLAAMLEADLYPNEIIHISELLWKKKWPGKLLLLKKPMAKILHKILEGKPTKADVKCLLLYRDAFQTPDVWFKELQPMLLKCISNKAVLVEHGSVSFLAKMFSLNKDILMLCHQEVKNYLVTKDATKQQARILGKVYAVACHEAEEDLKVVLMEQCMQFYMLKFIRTQWDIEKQTMLPLGHLLQELLDEFNNEVKKHPIILRLLNDAYDPILWRNLSNANSCFRINASHLLLNLFPLERPDYLRDENEKLINTQYNHMLAMLEDDCHLIRLMAVKEVCRIIAVFWECVPPDFKTRSIQIIITKLAFDRAMPEIRRQALLGLAHALANGPYSLAIFMGKNLQKLAPLLYDESKVVSRAMIVLLVALQKLARPNIATAASHVPTCWSIVQPKHVLSLLADEEVGSPLAYNLVELLFPSLHPECPIKQKERSIVKRVSWLVKTDLQAARNFYKNSKEILPIQNAIRFMQKVLTVLYRHCKKKTKLTSTSTPSASRKRKLSTEDKENSNIENVQDSLGSEMEASSQEEEEEESGNNGFSNLSLDNPNIVRGLLEVVFILWLQHVQGYRLPENEKYSRKLLEIAKDSLVEVYKTWRDDELVMHPLLLLASMLPNKRVRSLVSYSLSQIKCLMKKDGDLDKSNAGVLLTALCNWNCGDQVLELIGDCFSCAIQSALPIKTPTPRKNKRVKFEAMGLLSPTTALELMHLLLVHHINHDYLLKNCHTAVCELLLSLQPVQDLALQRLENGQPLSGICDGLTHKLFQRYVYLIPLVKSPVNQPYDVTLKFRHIVHWARKQLLPYTSQNFIDIEEMYSLDAVPLVALLLLDLCKGVSIAVHCTHISVELAQSLLNFCQDCLNSCVAQYLVPGVLCVTSAVAYQIVCEGQGRRDINISEQVTLSQVLEVVNKALVCCVDNNTLHTALREDVTEKKVESNIEELLNALCIQCDQDAPEISQLTSSFLQAVLQLTESEMADSESLYGTMLPCSAEYFLRYLLQSPVSSELVARQFVRLLYDNFGERVSGRDAAEVVVQTLESLKWRGVFGHQNVQTCRHALDGCKAAALERSMHIETDQESP